MSDLRGERIDADKIWSACPNCAALREENKRLKEDREIVLIGGNVTTYQAEPCSDCAALRGERDEALASIKQIQDYFGDVTVVAKERDALRAEGDTLRQMVENLTLLSTRYADRIKQLEEAVEWALMQPYIRGMHYFITELRRRAGRVDR